MGFSARWSTGRTFIVVVFIKNTFIKEILEVAKTQFYVRILISVYIPLIEKFIFLSFLIIEHNSKSDLITVISCWSLSTSQYVTEMHFCIKLTSIDFVFTWRVNMELCQSVICCISIFYNGNGWSVHLSWKVVTSSWNSDSFNSSLELYSCASLLTIGVEGVSDINWTLISSICTSREVSWPVSSILAIVELNHFLSNYSRAQEE